MDEYNRPIRLDKIKKHYIIRWVLKNFVINIE
jgi:hypothetical protein